MKKKPKVKYLQKQETSFFEQKQNLAAADVTVIPKGKSKHLTNKKILILCEGQTEVNYFRGIIESYTLDTATASNPYTDVDKLMAILLENTQS